jgi:hypothetical protein
MDNDFIGPVVSVDKANKDLYDSTRYMEYLAKMVQRNPDDNKDFVQNLAEEVLTFLKLAGWTRQ